ncbi:hypothetical protein [Smaragdicoccus niigatensis]|uniref:hypothetical protein n=1 Tax=Smaragdicoccus niigatensis TaxID=359359 RepID=UPI000362F388|nr:hypothetical protein [Smaragdicoccus niigatensis]
MVSSAMKDLAAELGATPPDGFAKLSIEQIKDLAVALRDIKRTQGAAIDESTEASISALPLMLRAPVRAIVGGSTK